MCYWNGWLAEQRCIIWVCFQSFGYVSKTRAGFHSSLSSLCQSLWQSWHQWQLWACCPCAVGSPIPHCYSHFAGGNKKMLHLEPEASWGTQHPLCHTEILSQSSLEVFSALNPPAFCPTPGSCVEDRSGSVGQRFPLPPEQSLLQGRALLSPFAAAPWPLEAVLWLCPVSVQHRPGWCCAEESAAPGRSISPERRAAAAAGAHSRVSHTGEGSRPCTQTLPDVFIARGTRLAPGHGVCKVPAAAAVVWRKINCMRCCAQKSSNWCRQTASLALILGRAKAVGWMPWSSHSTIKWMSKRSRGRKETQGGV